MAENSKRPKPFRFPEFKGCKRMASEDKITTLPDDILLTILSLLTFKEAVATSILCRRWRYLWTSHPNLHIRYEDVVLKDDRDDVYLQQSGELEYPRENSLGLPYMQSKDFIFGQFAAHLSRLEYLMMDVGSFEGKQQFNKLPLFSNLKHLSLTCLNSSHGPCGMLRCYHTVVCFVEASPFLHRLELHFHIAPTTNPELRRIAIPPHRYLKEVLVSGFFGNELAKDIILSIFNFATELEKIEITTVCLYDLSKRPFKNWDADIEVVRRCMGQLHQRLPANAQLHFLDDRF